MQAVKVYPPYEPRFRSGWKRSLEPLVHLGHAVGIWVGWPTCPICGKECSYGGYD
ncbi:MAG: hypothetical protein ACXVP8_00950 [Actinomycetota bacterium]